MTDWYTDYSNDFIILGAGDDACDGRLGRDTIEGRQGNDRIFGGGSDDTVFGGGGNDYIEGEDGNDLLKGNGNNDTIYGGYGEDTIGGGGGNDTIEGGAGSDKINGGSGEDVIAFGDDDADTLDGGRNADEFVFEGRTADLPSLADKIQHFNPNKDKLVFEHDDFDGDFDQFFSIRQAGDNVVIQTPDREETYVMLLKVDVEAITEADFVFV